MPSTYAGNVSSEQHPAPVPASFAFLSDRIHGCLLGGALGDAVAAMGADGQQELRISEATRLALYSLDGLQEAIEWANEGVGADETACIWLAYLRWLRSHGVALPDGGLVPLPRPIDAEPLLQEHPDAGSLDPEILAALSTGEMGTRQRPVNRGSASPAPLVRSAPFGLLPYVEADTVYKLSLDAASLTHGHPSALHAAAVFACTVHELLVPGATVRGAAAAAAERTAPAADGGAPELAGQLQSVLTGSQAGGTAAAAEVPAATRALVTGLRAALAAEDQAGDTAETDGPQAARAVADALRTAAAEGGVPAAVVAGALLGTRFGVRALPAADTLHEYSAIERLAAAFAEKTVAR